MGNQASIDDRFGVDYTYQGPREIPKGYYGLDMGTGVSEGAGVLAPGQDGAAPAWSASTGLDYSKPSGSGYNAYPGAGAGDPATQRPPYSIQSPNAGSSMGGVAQGAAAGAAVGGPYGAMIGAGVGLLQGIVEKKKQAAAAKLAYEMQQKAHAQRQVEIGTDKTFLAAKSYGDGQQSALSNLLGVFARSKR